jgi:hypothetical protein
MIHEEAAYDLSIFPRGKVHTDNAGGRSCLRRNGKSKSSDC